MTGTASDEHLLAVARAGDRQALETLLERHQVEVYRFGMKMCRDPEDAKDVLQDTLLAMARGVREFRGSYLACSIKALAPMIRRLIFVFPDRDHRRSTALMRLWIGGTGGSNGLSEVSWF